LPGGIDDQRIPKLVIKHFHYLGFDCTQPLSSFLNLGCIINLNSKSLYIEGISWPGSMTYFSLEFQNFSLCLDNKIASVQANLTAKHNKKGKQR